MTPLDYHIIQITLLMERLRGLYEDPQPGLITWRLAVTDVERELHLALKPPGDSSE